MRYYLDTEFDGFGGELISLALAAEDGHELYLANNKFFNDASAVTDSWVRENVHPILDLGTRPEVLPLDRFPRQLMRFIGTDNSPHFISDWPDDIRYLCQTMITGPGKMISMPLQFSFTVVRVDAYPTDLKGAVQHNALWDARALKRFLEKVKT